MLTLPAIALSLIFAADTLDVGSVALMTANGEYSQALELCEQADSLDDAAWYYRSLCESALGKKDEAIASSRRAVQLDSTNIYYYEQLFSALEAGGNRAASDSLYLDMVLRFPKKYRNEYALTMLGDRQMYDSHNPRGAQKYYEEALALDPNFLPALGGYAEACRYQGNYPGFFVSMDKILVTPELNAEAKCAYVDNFLERLDSQTYKFWGKQVDNMVVKLAATHPRDSSTLTLAGRWFNSTGQKELAESYFIAWKTACPRSISAHMTWITLMQMKDDYQAAIKACDEAIRLFKAPDELCDLYGLRASARFQIRDYKKAAKDYEKALKYDPLNPGYLNDYAYLLAMEGKKLKKAEKMARQSLELEPDNSSTLDTYAWILHLRGRDREAVQYFKKAMLYGGKESAVVLVHYSETLRALGENDLADYYLRISKTRK